MNLGKGFLVPPGKEALVSGFWMEMPSQGIPQDLPIETPAGNSNWQENGAAYLQPLEVQNHNMFHDFNGNGQGGIPGIVSSSPGNRNVGLNPVDETYPQAVNVDDGSWNGSWEQLLSLMTAPVDVPENAAVNKSMRSTNGNVVNPNSGNQSAIPLMKATHAVQRSGAASSSTSLAGQHLLPPSFSQGSNLMKAPPVSTWNRMQHKSCNTYSQQSSYQMQYNVNSSTPLDQSHYITSIHKHSNSSPYGTQEGFPVYNNHRYNLNPTQVDASSSITSSSQFVPPTPQQAKRAHQYPAETYRSLDQSLSQIKFLQGELMASSITQSSHFAPATPQPSKAVDNYPHSATHSLSIHQVQKQDKVQQELLPISIQDESATPDCQELFHNILDSSSTVIAPSSKERNDSGNEENQNIDLNETPLKKTPKRRKHRPKVIVEKKTPRVRKPAKERVGPDGIPVPKRKYVRKNKSDAVKTPKQDVQEKTMDSATEPASKSCKRSLDFELQDNIIDIDTIEHVDRQEKQHQMQENIFQNAIAQKSGFPIGSAHQSHHRNVRIQGNKEAGITTSFHPSVHQLQKQDIHPSNQHMLGAHPVTRDRQTDKSYASTGNQAKGATLLYQNSANGYQIPGQHHLCEGLGQTVQKITAQEEVERTRQMIERIQKERVSQYIQSRGCKRDYSCTKEHEVFGNSANASNSQLCQEILEDGHIRTNSRLEHHSGTQKRRKNENTSCTTNSNIQYAARFADRTSSQLRMNGYPVNHFLKVNGGLFNSCHQSNTSDELYPDPASTCMNLLRRSISSGASLGQEKLAQKEAKISALDHVITPWNAQAYHMQNQMPPNHVNFRTQSLVTETANRSKHAIVPIMKQNGGHILSKPAANRKGSHLKQKKTVPVDDITDQLKCLNLNSTNNKVVKDDQKALVPYKRDGTIVTYESSDPLKGKKVTPKVDLDSETNRVWNLLMGKEVNDDEKQTDEQKTKWWEEQRKVFRGRADSFIARMHLVQGDRRFSPWKGSVVDSVIGVFLTQNVTDHLSSSAFMTLAANFPPRPIRTSIASGFNKPGALIEQPHICIVEINDQMQWNEKFKNRVIYSRIANEPLDQQRKTSIEHIQQSVEANAQSLDELVSSQDSTESSSVHMNGAVQSLFTSNNSNAECPRNGCQSISRYSKMSFIVEEMENHVRFPSFTSQESGSSNYKTATYGQLQQNNTETSEQKQLDGTYAFDLNRPQLPSPNTSSNSCPFPAAGDLRLSDTDSCNNLWNQHHMSLHSTAASKDMGVTSTVTGQAAQVNTASIHNEKTWPTELPTENSDISQRKHNMDQKNTVQDYHHQSSCCDNQHDRTMITRVERESDKGPLLQQNKMAENANACSFPGYASSAQKNISAAEGPSRTKKNVSKEKGRKAEDVKKATDDWDSLRRQVKSYGKQRERSQETMDSIDYEALRHAEVRKISEVIRDRGMNNMLADRMKDFLNRIVRDHGSIDLEWLRDAPPDKAKDYLLSINGLGLKSVECIRLLTLHLHAFPVDTNVGRIAVRLGWVPLQPLPESLQLHLLERYPILESIQKYLYPRLYNLDQRTLYELHYQLITFGKVFCTKTKPNCNACPMRGECRHFASAFASSRLALPGPEEKSIVTSNSSTDTSKNPTIGVCPLPLHPLQDVNPEDSTFGHKTCEPIVEEPSTPEPESAEISEIADIEDAFYEDPDEIPTIRLNVEEFTQNLQSYLQEHMELQDGDMSKALVAFDTTYASIPTPKLKNVSRLRTEHQVYQLPDSHPLLKEFEKREPDDPSPYLLAIWTPGETANSIQPPEGLCNFQHSGKLCSKNACFECNSVRESTAQTVRGTILIPCRTAMRGSFPLNGTYFQVNEVFADHKSSLSPIDVPRSWIWNLPRRTVYFGTSVSAIFRGMSTEEIQQCFWRGFVCVRGFDQNTRLPKPLMARLHFSASKQTRDEKDIKKKAK